MLTTLVIKDFAIISKLELEFDEGMSVLTGETGAGKSIIVSALGLLLGGKSSPDIIRTGADEAVVEGMFTVDHQHAPTMAMLASIGIDLDDDEFVVRRVVPRKGRGKIYIGGTLQTVTTLRALMRTVIDISGQHEHVSLLDDAKHIDILDRYACLEERVGAFSKQFNAFSAMRRERDALATSLEERAKRLDFINYQIDELESVAVVKGEADQIANDLRVLANAESIQTAVESALSALYDDENSILSAIALHLNALKKASGGEKSILNIVDALGQGIAMIEDAVHDLRKVDIQEVSPERIESLQNRLSIIDKLERKYRVHADELEGVLDGLKAERNALVLSDERIAELDKAILEARREIKADAEEISRLRRHAALKLQKEATDGLHLLAMEDATIQIVCKTAEKFESMKSTGADEVKFLLQPNPGEDPRPLEKIASGGELSRVLLALKRAIVEKDDVACYIFDEVDTGIGGQTATHVAHMLREVSRCHQVLCITHLASIACYADAHYKVSKSVIHERTQSAIARLNDQERVEEIARMLGGTSKMAHDHAAEMIQQARDASVLKEHP